MRVAVLLPAGVEPVTVTEAKDYCRVTHSLEDDLFANTISSARELCEQVSRTPICLQTFRASFRWPQRETLYGLVAQLNDPDNIANGVPLPRRPVADVQAVRLVHKDGTSKELTTADYSVSDDTLRIRIDPDFNSGYTTLVIDFDAGWPPSAEDPETPPADIVADCPALYKQCVLDTVAHLYRNRGDQSGALPARVKQMLAAIANIGGYAG